MKNQYEHLRTDTRDQLPDWINYPQPEQVETIQIFHDGWQHIEIRIGQQDGYYVVGLTCFAIKGGHGFGPSRKWGQFSGRKDAMLWGLWKLLEIDDLVTGAARKAVQERLFSEQQPTLF